MPRNRDLREGRQWEGFAALLKIKTPGVLNSASRITSARLGPTKCSEIDPFRISRGQCVGVIFALSNAPMPASG